MNRPRPRPSIRAVAPPRRIVIALETFGMILFWAFLMGCIFYTGYVWGYTNGHANKNSTTDKLPFATNYKSHFRIRISSAFNEEQKNIIKDAINKWVAGVNNTKKLSVDVSVGDCPNKPDIVEACITPVNAQTVCCMPGAYNNIGCTWSTENYASVEIATERDNTTLSHLIQHELGHVFGIPDSDTENIIMNGIINVDGGSDLTPQDINLYLNRR